MSSLRILGASYLATASFFALAIACCDHAALRLMTGEAAGAANEQFQARIVAPLLMLAQAKDEKFLDPPTPPVMLKLAPPPPGDARVLAHADLPYIPPRTVAAPPLPPAGAVLIAPDLVPGRLVSGSAAPAAPDGDGLAAVQRAAVTRRLKDSLTPAMLRNFSLFLYVSKAAAGPLAQRLYVFKKKNDGDIALAYDWLASTGREQYEITPLGRHAHTVTPAGFYELDPDRMYRRYHSHAWDQPMPYAMFFNWERRGVQTGLAIHAASGADIARLGRRASAGCVHISPDHARQLYEMIHADYKGPVPRFAYDRAARTMSNTGKMMRDGAGHLVKAEGYKVLIDIEDYGGPVMAALD